VDADETTNVVSYTDLSTVGPQQTAPLTGEYLIDFGFQDYCANVSTGTVVFCSPKLGAAAAVDNDGIQSQYSNNNLGYSARSRRIRRSLTAADVVKLQYKNGGAGNAGHWRWRWLSLTPVRVLG
jgi:hypothetical protein